MKTKLTLSIDKKRVAQLRKASARRSKSISALIEEYADQLDKEEGRGMTFSEEFKDIFPIPIEAEWLDEDTRHAKHLRLSAAGREALARRKQGKG